MKPFNILLSILCVCIFSSVASAQLINDSSVYDETLWGMKKRKMIMDHMNLTEAEKASFWPVYESYSQAVRNIDTETLQIIFAVNDSASGLEQNELERYSKRLLHNELLLDKIRITYYKKFIRAISPSRASEFMQVDDNLRTMLRLEIQESSQTSNAAQASLN